MAPPIDKLTPNDPRVQSRFIDVEGRRWHYLEAQPSAKPKGTIMLVHGFPDFSFGWRYQIPYLAGLGYRVFALDCMGYGKTGFSPNLKDYTFFSHAKTIAAIAKSTNTPSLILGGHDWGGAIVYRVAQWYPSLIRAVFSIATPYASTSRTFTSTETLARGKLPNFGYQLQLGSEEGVVEGVVAGREELVGKFLRGMYGGRTERGRPFMTPERGVDLGVLTDGEVGGSPLLDESEQTFYTTTFHANPLRGPTNWYRTRRANYEDELNLPEAQRNHIHQPVLFVQALKDNVLVPAMSKGMEKVIPRLTRAEVPTGHWALWQAPERVNEIVGGWLERVEREGGGGSKL